MARFDFIEAAASSYRFLMVEHALIGRMVLFPLVLKIVSFAFILALGLGENYLRQGLLLIPSFFAEGWLVAQLIRLAIFRETWPAMLSGDRRKDMALLHVRFRAILSATIIYVLLKLLGALLSGLAFQANATYADPERVSEPSSLAFLVGMVAIGFAIWAFRFLWLYVPAALDFPIKDFLHRIRAFKISILMIATSLLCTVPLALVFLMMAEFMSSIFPSAEGEELSVLYQYIMVCVQAFLELLIAIVSSVAIAHGIMAFYPKSKKG